MSIIEYSQGNTRVCSVRIVIFHIRWLCKDSTLRLLEELSAAEKNAATDSVTNKTKGGNPTSYCNLILNPDPNLNPNPNPKLNSNPNPNPTEDTANMETHQTLSVRYCDYSPTPTPTPNLTWRRTRRFLLGMKA